MYARVSKAKALLVVTTAITVVLVLATFLTSPLKLGPDYRGSVTSNTTISSAIQCYGECRSDGHGLLLCNFRYSGLNGVVREVRVTLGTMNASFILPQRVWAHSVSGLIHLSAVPEIAKNSNIYVDAKLILIACNETPPSCLTTYTWVELPKGLLERVVPVRLARHEYVLSESSNSVRVSLADLVGKGRSGAYYARAIVSGKGYFELTYAEGERKTTYLIQLRGSSWPERLDIPFTRATCGAMPRPLQGVIAMTVVKGEARVVLDVYESKYIVITLVSSEGKEITLYLPVIGI